MREGGSEGIIVLDHAEVFVVRMENRMMKDVLITLMRIRIKRE
jgi:hypothetical protein